MGSRETQSGRTSRRSMAARETRYGREQALETVKVSTKRTIWKIVGEASRQTTARRV